jgi:hypothetical protein
MPSLFANGFHINHSDKRICDSTSVLSKREKPQGNRELVETDTVKASAGWRENRLKYLTEGVKCRFTYH